MRKSIQKIQNFKKEGKKITVLTAYDYSTAKYFDQAGVDMILVGDSLAQVALGYNNTTDVGMDEMLVFTTAVSRAVENALVIADMPFMSFQVDKAQTMKNACEFIKALFEGKQKNSDIPELCYAYTFVSKNGFDLNKEKERKGE